MTVSGMRHMNGRYLRDKLKVSLRVTACGREVIMPILGLVWQESMCAVAAMSRKTNVKSDFNGEKMCNSIPNTQVEYKLCQKVLAQNTTTTS